MKLQWDPREILRYLGADHATPLIQELMERALRMEGVLRCEILAG